MKLIFIFLFFSITYFSQTNDRKTMLDSINKSRENQRGVFKLYIKKLKVEVIAGVFRNRETSNQGFEPINLTYNIYLPFQFDLNYLNIPAKEKILKINPNLIIHHSKYGNYAIGLGNRFSFLIHKKMYLSYQIGLVWCEPVKKNTNDGINFMGFCFQHQFSFSYILNKHIELSANVLHISNANLFKGVKNNQDVLGVGIAYQF